MAVDSLTAQEVLSADIKRISSSFMEICMDKIKETMCETCRHRPCDQWCVDAFKAGVHITNMYILYKLRWN